MKSIAVLVIFLSAFAAQAEPFAAGNAGNGKKLFDQNNCNRCHKSIMGGDGSAIFTRVDHKVRSPKQLVTQLYICSGNAGISLSKQDEQDLGAYLNKTYYHFK
jgi:cytochrome c peroxidase